MAVLTALTENPSPLLWFCRSNSHRIQFHLVSPCSLIVCDNPLYKLRACPQSWLWWPLWPFIATVQSNPDRLSIDFCMTGSQKKVCPADLVVILTLFLKYTISAGVCLVLLYVRPWVKLRSIESMNQIWNEGCNEARGTVEQWARSCKRKCGKYSTLGFVNIDESNRELLSLKQTWYHAEPNNRSN